jgi:hypothetical protein
MLNTMRPCLVEPGNPAAGRYCVDPRSVINALSGDYWEDTLEIDGFEAARDHAVDALEYGIAVLVGLVKELKEAEDFEDLDLGWHEPLLTEADFGAQTHPD